jgi:leader peptidase (prepilin peptidase)/N-methyltransferase
MEILGILAASPVLFSLVAGLFGLLIGSFLNVVIYRLPVMMEREWRIQCADLMGQTPPDEPVFNLVTPRSRCPQCNHIIGAKENIPLVSYLLQRGRCAHCKTPISIQYPFIEALTGLLTVVVAWHFGFGWQAAAAIVLTWALIALSVIDFKTQLLPDSITLPFLWFGIALALFGIFTDLNSSVIGAMAGYLSLWSVYHLFRLLTGKEGMGFGDFKLLALLGAWQGWQFLPAIIILSSLVGAILGSVLILLRGRDRNLPMPFGPFLAIAGWITLLWGDSLNQAYMRWMGI